MFCSNCGKELPDNANFCYACGSPVTKPESETKEVKKSSDKEATSINPIKGTLKLKSAKTEEELNNSKETKESENKKAQSDSPKISSIKIASDTNNTNLKTGTEKTETSNSDSSSNKPKTAKDFLLSKNKEKTNNITSTNQEKYPKGFKGRRTLGGLPGTRTASTIPGNIPVYSKDNSSSSDNNSQSNSKTAKVPNVDLSSFKTPASQPTPSGPSSNTATNTKKPVTMGMKLGVFVAIFLGAVLALSFLYISDVARRNMRSSSSSSYSSDSSSDYSDKSYSNDSDSSSSSSYSSDSYSSDNDDSYSKSSKVSTIYASSAQWPFYDYFMRDHFFTSSSSYLMNSGSITYNPSNVTDNDSKTAWVANKKGSDVGEYLNMSYSGDSDFTLHRLYFLNGYTKDMETFNKNTTPTELEFGINGDKIAILKLMADPNPQVIELETPITLTSGDTLNFEITQAQTGPNDNVIDTAISDIRVE